MLELLRNTRLTRATDVEDLVELSVIAKLLVERYESLSIGAPDWLIEKRKDVDNALHVAVRDSLQAQLSVAKSRLASLATPDEKREAARKEVERLAALVGA